MHHTDRIRSASSLDQQLIFQVLKFIDENYRDGQLTDLAAQLGYEIPWLSDAIKRLLGRTYKELQQIKRLNQAAFLLQSTRLPITDICAAVGYDNTSYFHPDFPRILSYVTKRNTGARELNPLTPFFLFHPIFIETIIAIL